MIAILNTGLANASSVLFSIERVGYSAILTQDPEVIKKSNQVILPGVGTAGALMKFLAQQNLVDCLKQLKQPVLGICLGMQIQYEFSNEGNVSCLGIHKGTIKRFDEKDTGKLPIPHMGWNQVQDDGNCALLKGMTQDPYFYFIHSFHAPAGSETKATTEYGKRIPAVTENSNWFGTQFHPEKSGPAGEKLLKNFLNL